MIDAVSKRRRRGPNDISTSSSFEISTSIDTSSNDQADDFTVGLTARDMAVSAAVESSVVKARRRIDQLKLIYIRMNEERLSHL
jgi:ABC-type molybdenum transport system ATPase subunit/photorepair protein PhrA